MPKKPTMIPEEVAQLRTQVALLEERVKEAEKEARGFADAYRDLERMHTPTAEEGYYREIGEAIATLWLYRDLLPAEFMNNLTEAMLIITDAAKWQTTPELIERIFPILVGELDRRRRSC